MELLTRLQSDYCTLHVGTAATDWILLLHLTGTALKHSYYNYVRL